MTCMYMTVTVEDDSNPGSFGPKADTDPATRRELQAKEARREAGQVTVTS